MLSTSPAFSMSSASHSAGSSGRLAPKNGSWAHFPVGREKLMPFVDPDRIKQSDRVQAASFAKSHHHHHHLHLAYKRIHFVQRIKYGHFVLITGRMYILVHTVHTCAHCTYLCTLCILVHTDCLLCQLFHFHFENILKFMNDFIVNLAFIYMSVLRSAMCCPFTVPLPCFVRAQFDILTFLTV